MAELEGFLCPLCKQDSRSVHELETHYREAHDESTASKFKKDFRSFFENAFNISPKQTRAQARAEFSRSTSAGEEEPVQEPVTNVSGIDTELWPKQEMGHVTVHSIQFRKVRDARLAGVTVDTNRMVIRLEKLFRSIRDAAPRTAKEKRSIEQNMVPWKKDKEEKQCHGCGAGFGLRRRRHHCRLCGDIRCKECSHFMTLVETYPLLHDCPDYASLAPPPSIAKKKLKFKVLKQDSSCPDDDEEATDEVRMCVSCKKLINGRLNRLGALEKNKLVVMYEKMRATMVESEDKKPGFVETARLIRTGGHGPTLQEATVERQQLLRVYETIDSISKRILSIGASDPSPRAQKLARGVRAYVSNYLQEHLLTLPSLPTQQQLAEIKERREREAEERLAQIEQQREEQRILNAKREAEAAAEEKSALEKMSAKITYDVTTEKISEGFGKFTSDMDRLFSRETIKDISKEFQSIIPSSSKKEGKEEQDKGWMCNSNQVVTSLDPVDNPFAVQRDQLLSFIAQAQEARRFDEVRALEESLHEIEAVMQEQKSFGF